MKNKSLSLIFVLALSSTLVACSSSDITYERYCLTQDVSAEALTSNYDVHIYLQDYLNVGGIVIQTNDLSLQESVKRRWISSIDNQLSILFKDILIKKKMNKSYKYELYVSNFHGTEDGFAKVSLFLKIYDAKQKLIKEKEFSSKTEIKEDGYDSLVNTLKSEFIRLLSSM